MAVHTPYRRLIDLRPLGLLGTALALASVGVSGCSAPTATDPGAEFRSTDNPTAADTRPALLGPPGDFTLSITVLGPVPEGGVGMVARPQRPGRYVLEPDRQLRAAIGPGASPRAFPPAVRRLTHAQVGELWTALKAGSMLNPGHAGVISRMPDVERFSGRQAYLIDVVQSGRRRTLVIDSAKATPEELAEAATLTEKLAALSYVPE